MTWVRTTFQLIARLNYLKVDFRPHTSFKVITVWPVNLCLHHMKSISIDFPFCIACMQRKQIIPTFCASTTYAAEFWPLLNGNTPSSEQTFLLVVVGKSQMLLTTLTDMTVWQGTNVSLNLKHLNGIPPSFFCFTSVLLLQRILPFLGTLCYWRCPRCCIGPLYFISKVFGSHSALKIDLSFSAHDWRLLL